MTFATERLARPRTPGSIRYINQRMPGESPHDLDDFFTDEDHSAWTLVQTSGTTTPAEKYSTLSLVDAGTTARQLNGMAKSISGFSAPLTIETAFSWIGPPGAGRGVVSLGFIDGFLSTSNDAVFTVFAGIDNTAFNAGTLGTFDAAPNDIYERAAFYGPSRTYLRIAWKSANTFRVALSTDGVGWHDPGGDQSKTMIPTHAILGVSTYRSSDATMVGFDYFRAYDADLIT